MRGSGEWSALDWFQLFKDVWNLVVPHSRLHCSGCLQFLLKVIWKTPEDEGLWFTVTVTWPSSRTARSWLKTFAQKDVHTLCGHVWQRWLDSKGYDVWRTRRSFPNSDEMMARWKASPCPSLVSTLSHITVFPLAQMFVDGSLLHVMSRRRAGGFICQETFDAAKSSPYVQTVALLKCFKSFSW